jgi:AmmeMemoRadiSam system protein A
VSAILARWARDSLRHALGGPAATPPAGFDERAATFVTLRWRDGTLQGCIGTLDVERSLVADVAHNAVAAGTRDRRGRTLALDHIDALDVEVSILSALEPIAGEHEIRCGTDGVVIVRPPHRATFLPQMWSRLPELRAFMAALHDKLGGRGPVAMLRYTVEHHVEPGT